MASLTIALVYELLGSLPRTPGDPPDADAEYEPEETVRVLEAALRVLGHHPVRIGSPETLLAHLGKGELPPVDAALNIAEGRGSRNREAWAPVLLEMAGVPTLGSDALTLSATLDKHWASTLVARAGVPTPEQVVLHSADEATSAVVRAWPLFVKPRWEGTAKGIRSTSKVTDRVALAREVARIVRDYQQPALVEAFVPGAEYTVTVVGNDPPRALAAVQRALEPDSGIGVHALEREAPDAGFEPVVPGVLDAELEDRLGELSIRAFRALECRDFARVDFRLDEGGHPLFLEINPLPTFAREGTFGILAELEGRPLEVLLAEVFGDGLRRLGLA